MADPMEVTIEVDRGEVTARDATGGESEPSRVDFDDLRLKTIRVFEARLGRNDIKTRDELAVLGEHLYVGLFTGGVRNFVEERLRDASEHRRLLLRLRLPEPGIESQPALDLRLANLPWEYLYCPSVRGGLFLTTRVMLVLSRFLPIQPPRGEPDNRDDDTLKVGVIFANPDDSELPAVATERLREDLRKLQARRSDIQIDMLDNPSLSRVHEWLTELQPQVLQFVGHGGYDPSESLAKIVLVDENGYAQDVAGGDLVGVFDQLPHTPSVVLLHLPAVSSSNGIEANLTRLAPGLIRGGVPAVVAMQHPFGDEPARHFSTAFFKALADGEPIDLAVTTARLAFQRNVAGVLDNRAFGTPVLYARAYSSVVRRPLVTPPETDGEPPQDASAKSVAAPPQDDRGGDAVARPSIPDGEASDGLTVARNGAGRVPQSKDAAVVKRIVGAGRLAMDASSPQLGAQDKAIVYGWFKQLEEELVSTSGGEELANAMRWAWRDTTDDERLQQISLVMENTARRQEP
jgi:CHAT domain